ncbi:response regulator [Bacteriovoracaceae bacterium]|nr:response regulator [Bacteriovoracaceae bacterium]
MILSIDDDVDFNKLLELLLKKNKFDCHCTSNPKEFIHELINLEPKLCLVDLNLDANNGEGYQLIKAIRNKRGNKLPLIVLSGRSSSRDISKAFEMGANDYIQKPIDEFSLIKKLKEYITPLSVENVEYFPVPPMMNECRIFADVSLTKLTEEKIILKSNHFFSKETLIYLPQDICLQLFGKNEERSFSVKDNWIEDDKTFFNIELGGIDSNMRSNYLKFLRSL